jgi:hypothetical protein
LKLKCDEPLSSLVFEFNLRRYTLGLNVARASYAQSKTALTRAMFRRLAAAGARWVRVPIRCGDAYFIPAR